MRVNESRLAQLLPRVWRRREGVAFERVKGTKEVKEIKEKRKKENESATKERIRNRETCNRSAGVGCVGCELRR